MIKIVATMIVKTENMEQFLAEAKELVEKSAAEEGNISYSLNASISDPKTYAIIEFWKDKDAIDIHNNSEHFTHIFPRISNLLQEKMSIEVFKEI